MGITISILITAPNKKLLPLVCVAFPVCVGQSSDCNFSAAAASL